MITTRVESLKGNRGAILFEAVFSLMVVMAVMVLNLELIRRIQLEIVFHHGSFLAVRERILGESDSAARRLVGKLWRSALGEAGQWHFARSDHREREGRDSLVRSSSSRYLAFLPFRETGLTKHHFEVTEACKFSLAHY